METRPCREIPTLPNIPATPGDPMDQGVQDTLPLQSPVLLLFRFCEQIWRTFNT